MIIIATLIGLILGIIFFGGLWLTVKKTTGTPQAPLWFLASFLLRMFIVLLGFYYFSQQGLLQLGMCFIGFIISRFLVFRVTKQLEQKSIASIKS